MSPEPTGVHGLLKQRKLFTHKYIIYCGKKKQNALQGRWYVSIQHSGIVFDIAYRMAVLNPDLIQIGILVVALANLIYQVYKGKKK